ncbi:hypothetical protein JHK82_029067 [Glycine max]|nr:hypothetical protein JHK82_029067 [Glycine max]
MQIIQASYKRRQTSMGWVSEQFICAFLVGCTFLSVLSHPDKVIGGGTCGCPLAATLSQGARVLVLERRGSPYTNPEQINIKNFVNSLADISPSSFSQPFISRDGVLNSRARVLGGGSVLNAGFYSRASSTYIRDSGWNETLAKDSYKWVEEKVAFEPPMLQWQSAVKDGLLEVGVLPYSGFTFDHLYGTKVGGTIFDKEEKRRPQAYGVIFKDALGVMHRAYLSTKGKNELILSAGAIGSPQLLLLSGIGHANHLEAHGIKVVLDQPLVGQGMADNPLNVLVVPSPVPVEASLVQTLGITKFGSFIEAASGLSLGHSWSERLQGIFEFVSNQSGQPSTFPPEAKESVAETVRSLANPILKGGVLLEKIIGPRSTGHLELINTNPNDNPSVTFNYFKGPEDLRKCVEGMKTIIDVINSSILKIPLPQHASPSSNRLDVALASEPEA